MQALTCYNEANVNARAVLQTPASAAELVTGLKENKSDMPESSTSISPFTNILPRSRERRRCTMEGCDKFRKSRGYCATHLSRYFRYGSPYVNKHNPAIYCILDESTIQIPLRDRQGNVRALTTIDAVYAERVNRWRWQLGKKNYVDRKDKAGGQAKTISLARFLMGLGDYDPSEQVDHINRNPLDNRRKNLRVVTARENSANRGGKYERGKRDR